MRKLTYVGILFLVAVVGASIWLGQKAGTRQIEGTGAGAKITATSSTPYVPANQGEAEGTVPNFHPGGDDLRASVLAQPLPQVWLVTPAQVSPADPGAEKDGAVRIDLPDEARTALTPIWKAYLEYYLKTDFDHEKEAQRRLDRDVAMVTTAAKTAAGLEELSINAPDGRRRLSHDEALGIVSFLGRSAKGVVEQAKQYKSQTQPGR